jgi:glycosyltransferase involved in cell wall biosynthesis
MKWLFLTPRNYYEGYSWLGRDMGLSCLGMRELGVEASFGVYRAHGFPTAEPFLPLEPGEVACANWWRKSGFTHCFALTSARRIYEPIIRAAKDAGVWIGIRMDSDGWQSPRQGIWRYFRDLARFNVDTNTPFAQLRALTKTAFFRAVPAQSDRIWLRQFQMADAICIESPDALRRLAGFFDIVGAQDLKGRLLLLPGPVSQRFTCAEISEKRNKMLAVGIWSTRQKNPKLLVSTLARFLTAHTDWEVIVAGRGEQNICSYATSLIDSKSESILRRILIVGPITRDQLRERYLESKILLSTSHAEGFPNVAAEAVCSGCSIVGPQHIASMRYFVSKDSGTLYKRLIPQDAAAALTGEACAWHEGARNPHDIATGFRKELSHTRVANTLLQSAIQK